MSHNKKTCSLSDYLIVFLLCVVFSARTDAQRNCALVLADVFDLDVDKTVWQLRLLLVSDVILQMKNGTNVGKQNSCCPFKIKSIHLYTTLN